MTARLHEAGMDAAQSAVEAMLWEERGAAGAHDRGQCAEGRSVVVASADVGLRQRLAEKLSELRWKVRQAKGGAEAMMLLETHPAVALLLDGWLPDLEVREFAAHVRLLYPEVEQLPLDGKSESRGCNDVDEGVRSPQRSELLYAIREAQAGGVVRPTLRRMREQDASILPILERETEAYRARIDGTVTDGSLNDADETLIRSVVSRNGQSELFAPELKTSARAAKTGLDAMLPELVGVSEAMREVALLVRLVAPRSTSVLIEGETGTGKEVVARALHRLSARAAKPFVVLNCAAIPEYLLEAELFGHTRGAFTGAVQSRMGRIEAADGGTLLLDEIGEMPLGMQAKMLRFLESGELQRVGDNETLQVDVRMIAATHQPLEEQAEQGRFRLDLYHRLAVFPIDVPPLRERVEDVAVLAEHFLEQMGQLGPRKRLTAEATAKLEEHSWPGNVRELMHVLERGVILAGANPEIAAEDIRYRKSNHS